MPAYIRRPYKFLARGLGLRYPPDAMPDGFYPILNNMEARLLGGIQPRAGILALNAFTYPSPIHSIRRLNDPTNSTFARLIGAGASIYDSTSTVAIDNGYSGSPLSMVPFRPLQSPSPWMYVSDAQRSRKIRTDRTNYPQGIAPPTQPPSVARGIPNYTIIESFAAGAAGNWAISGNANTLSEATTRFNETITAILYDTGSTGWCSIQPSALGPDYQPGAVIKLTSGEGNETAKIRQVFEAIANTTIASILYDTGSTGLCSIVLTAQGTGLQPDAMIQLGGSSEYVRILSVSSGPQNQVSFRCSTVNTHAAGDSVTGLASFRIYTVANYDAGDTLTGKIFTFNVTTGAPGNLYNNTYTTNLATINSRPVQLGDYMHISILVDNPALVTNCRVIINLDAAFPSDFTQLKNALYKDLTVDPFQSSVNLSLADLNAQQQALQQQIINAQTQANNNQPAASPPDSGGPQPLTVPVGSPTGGIDTAPDASPIPDNAALGVSQWTELNFHLSEMTRVGAGQTDTLSAPNGLAIVLTTTGTVAVAVSSWWIGGTYGPDSGGALPYTFFERFSAPKTSGARSNPSPIMRSGIDLQRELAIITPTTSPDGQTDSIDLFAQGGSLPQPTLIATIPNAATPFNDDIMDSSVITNEILDFTLFQPFPVTDLPRTGTCDISGTSMLWDSGDVFNVNWQTGSRIIINGNVYTLYGPPASNHRLELIEDAGSLSAATFIIPGATIGGQPLPAMWGPDPITGVLFALGTSKEGGTLYWTNPNDPDSASDANNLPIDSPSEPLQNGFMYDGRCYVASTERVFNCYPQTQTDPTTGKQTLTYVAQEVPNGKGLYGIYAFCFGPSYWLVTRTGIFQGGDSGLQSITDESLYPLFPHGGQVGTLTNGYYPIDFSQPNAMRLFYTKGALYFVYVDTQGTYQCMKYNMTLPTPGWFPVQYTPTPRVIYEEEGQNLYSILMGGSDGTIQQLGQGTGDNANPIAFNFYTPSLDLGDSRLQKLFLDYMVDMDQGNAALTLTPYVNKLKTALGATALAASNGRAQTPVNIIQTLLALYQDISLNIAGSTTPATGTPVFYEFEPNAVMQPYLAVNMTSPNYMSHGFTTYGHLRDGYFVWISTTAIAVTIITELGLTYTFNLPSSGGGVTKKYFPLAPLKGLLFYYSAVSTSPFALFTDETIVHVKEWGNTGPFVSFKPWQGQSA